MNEPILKDPRTLYHPSKFADQEQDTPALQKHMLPAPDCGEESYVGNHLLENRRVLITGGDSGGERSNGAWGDARLRGKRGSDPWPAIGSRV